MGLTRSSPSTSSWPASGVLPSPQRPTLMIRLPSSSASRANTSHVFGGRPDQGPVAGCARAGGLLEFVLHDAHHADTGPAARPPVLSGLPSGPILSMVRQHARLLLQGP